MSGPRSNQRSPSWGESGRGAVLLALRSHVGQDGAESLDLAPGAALVMGVLCHS